MEIKHPDLKETLNILEEVFMRVGIDFYYLIGAMARNIWYEKVNLTSRGTRDIDFAVLISQDNQFEEVKAIMQKDYGFRIVKDNAFALENDKLSIDLIPFGSIEALNGRVVVSGQGMQHLKVNGFSEIAKSGISVVNQENLTFKIATLPSIVLLKLISFDDRPEFRHKDVQDIAQILKTYYEIENDLVLDKHFDLLERINEGHEVISAKIIGRNIKQILSDNQVLRERVVRILTDHIEKASESTFIDIMSRSLQLSVKQCQALLIEMLAGIVQKQ